MIGMVFLVAATIERRWSLSSSCLSRRHRICKSRFKNDYADTVEMYLNNGWEFCFRIYSAGEKVSPCLGFDVQIVGLPIDISRFSSKL
ncbi:MAG: HaeIII family restriction endonuclease [Enterococcus sp.]|nr:HaeIII family restriction endonuclease [Enterococcus sp.]